MSRRSIVTLAIASVAIFMVTLDNLVVTTALPSIRRDLGASLEDLEWTVNGYTLAFAVFLLTGAALGDRFGRRRMFLIGIAIFTGASAFAALAPSTDALIAARAIQGLGGAIVAPLTLTLLSAAFPADKRGLALGIWSGIGGLAVAMGRSSAAPSSRAARGSGSSGSTSRSGSRCCRSRAAASSRASGPPTGSTSRASRSPRPACWASSTPPCAGTRWAGGARP